MKKIEFLRTGTALSLALAVHLVTFYGIAAATPAPRHAVVRIGPVEAVSEVITPRMASQTARLPEG